jgi:alpha-beta hydrolase superfamily lysophospholipase
MSDRQDFFIPGPAGRLSLRSKGLAARPRHLVILVQGANMSGQMGYDFGFDGGQGYSMMDALVAAGFGALTFSVRGYAQSELMSTDGFAVQTDAAIEDLSAVVAWAQSQGWARPHLLGWSWGGRITGRYTEDHAAEVDRLVLMDPALGGGQKILPVPTDAWWSNSYAYFIDRLEPEFSEDAAREALARRMDSEELKAPNGIRLENALGTKRVEPDRVARPTLMLYGSAAAKQNYMQGGWNRLDFFEKLATEDKAYVLIPGCGDYAHLQKPRQRIYQSCIDFLRQPSGD